MESTDHAAPSNVTIQLAFIESIAVTNMTQFVLTTQATNTTVMWKMHGPMPFTFKVMRVCTSMDAMVGKDVEKGLSQSKAAAEK